MNNIASFLKMTVKFVFWGVFAWGECDEYDANDYSAMTAIFISFGMSSAGIAVITFFARPEYFYVTTAICFSVYFLSGILFCWFLKSQYDYNFLR